MTLHTQQTTLTDQHWWRGSTLYWLFDGSRWVFSDFIFFFHTFYGICGSFVSWRPQCYRLFSGSRTPVCLCWPVSWATQGQQRKLTLTTDCSYCYSHLKSHLYMMCSGSTCAACRYAAQCIKDVWLQMTTYTSVRHLYRLLWCVGDPFHYSTKGK